MFAANLKKERRFYNMSEFRADIDTILKDMSIVVQEVVLGSQSLVPNPSFPVYDWQGMFEASSLELIIDYMMKRMPGAKFTIVKATNVNVDFDYYNWTVRGAIDLAVVPLRTEDPVNIKQTCVCVIEIKTETALKAKRKEAETQAKLQLIGLQASLADID
ncbi:hypothetical protein HK405_004717 [Cladochytrium tenue]|nr:hypothetical protein HK405_004717 [Cladochytrium tenue]